MAKFVIPVEKLPPPYTDGFHTFRFRVTTEDRNSISQYSNLYELESVGQIYPQESEYSIVVQSGIVTVAWETPSIYNVGEFAVGPSVQHNHESEWKVHDSDIFVKFNNFLTPDFIYWGRSKDNTVSILPYSGATNIHIVAQVANHPPTKSTKFQLFDTGVVSLL
jgi:hypothetical protein